MKILQCFILLTIVSSCATTNKSSSERKARDRMRSLQQDAVTDINELLKLIEYSQTTDPGMVRSVPYAFSIPADTAKMNEVYHIDSLIQFNKDNNYYRCIGDNATKEKVLQIVALPYTFKIRHFEYK